MENSHISGQTGSGQAGANLSLAVDRLSRALDALELRLQNLQSPEFQGTDGFGASPALQEEYARMRAELEEARVREAQLAHAAHGAFEALGAAAANIRILLRDEAA